MASQTLSTKHIEYIEKDFLDDFAAEIDTSSLRIASMANPQFIRITGLADFWESHYGKAVAPRLLMEDIISGISEEGIPLVFALFGSKNRVEVFIGTYDPDAKVAKDNLAIIKTSLQSSFQGIEMAETPPGVLKNNIEKFNFSALATGIPTNKAGSDDNPNNKSGVDQIDRMVRGLFGRNWGYTVVARPTKNEEINKQFNIVLNEMRVVINLEKGTGGESPIGKRYKKLLEASLNKLQLAKAQGLWHTSVFLFSPDSETLSHIKAVVKSSLGGKESVPDRVRTHNLKETVIDPGLILNTPSDPPGQFSYPYSFSSSINSADLASYIQLPSKEMPGFQIKPYARFKVSTNQKKNEGIKIGKIIDQGNDTGNSYKISLNRLKKHGLIVGGTGSGKTNTIFYLLKEAWKQKVPFMVIEPVKTEYRKLLLSKEMGTELQVFTLGDNNVSPFRINPFEIMPGVSVQTHIDLLKAVFNASFFMWGPLPHVLERCIHDIYLDKGWDLTSNKNPRGTHRNANPTLTDLYNKIDEIVDSLEYSAETTMEISSALKTRIDSLRIGGKGLMLDTRTSIPYDTLISKPTILELEPIGDDEEKCFMMGLILTMMYENHISRGISENKGLEHLTVVEEAHRLLGNYSAENAFTANVKGKAVEAFTNILAEIRAYGEGFLIAEQIPTKLASDVIKNTNLKVMHRVVADDDRKVMGATMNIGERETKKIVSLNVGEAAIYSEGDEGAFHVKVPYSKIEGEENWKGKGDEVVMESMKDLKKTVKHFAPFESCLAYCRAICEYKSIGSKVAEDHKFYSQIPTLVLSFVHDLGSIDPVILEMLESVGEANKDPKGKRICCIIHGVEQHFEQIGNHYQWPFEEVARLKELFLEAYHEVINFYSASGDQVLSEGIDQSKVAKFRELYLRLSLGKQPTSFCSQICPDNHCLYKFNMTDALKDVSYQRTFVDTVNKGGEDMWYNLHKLCKEAALESVLPNGDEEIIKKIALCFALQKGFSQRKFRREHIQTMVDQLLEFDTGIEVMENDKLKEDA